MSIKETLNKLLGIEFYSVNVICDNCSYKGKVEIEVGNKLDNNTKCPKCRCHGVLYKLFNKEEKCQDKQE